MPEGFFASVVARRSKDEGAPRPCGELPFHDAPAQAAEGTKGPARVHQDLWSTHRVTVQATAWHVRRDRLGAAWTGRLFHPRASRAETGDVLLQRYRSSGTQLLQELHGEFAFALWDGDRERLLLARDLSGSYPLYVSEANDALSVSTRLTDLLRGNRAPQLDEAHLAHWLALLPPEPGSTFFRGIRSVPPGSVLVYERGRLVEASRCTPPDEVAPRDLRNPCEYAEHLSSLLQQAVHDRIDRDAEVASTLSGGLDSSAITALAAQELAGSGRRLHAFTAVPSARTASLPGHFSDEWSRAALVAAQHDCVDHTPVAHGQHRILPLIDCFNRMELRPIVNPANYDWLYEICLRAAKAGARSILMGLAGNLTASYDGAAAVEQMASQHRIAQAIGLGVRLARGGDMRWRAVARQALQPALPGWLRHRLLSLSGAPSRLHHYSFIHPDLARAHGIQAQPATRARLTPRERRLLALGRVDMGSTLQAMRERTGVHITDPTMDRRVVDFCLSLPDEVFCQGGVLRGLMRQAMRGTLPEAVRLERRRGLQSADFGVLFQRELAEARREVAALRQVPAAVAYLDLARVDRHLSVADGQTGPQSQRLYWPPLMRALSLGRFVRDAQDGTLFHEVGTGDRPESLEMPQFPRKGTILDTFPHKST